MISFCSKKRILLFLWFFLKIKSWCFVLIFISFLIFGKRLFLFFLFFNPKHWLGRVLIWFFRKHRSELSLWFSQRIKRIGVFCLLFLKQKIFLLFFFFPKGKVRLFFFLLIIRLSETGIWRENWTFFFLFTLCFRFLYVWGKTTTKLKVVKRFWRK